MDRYFRCARSISVVVVTLCLAATLVSCSSPPAPSNLGAGDHLAKLCALPQLEVLNENQAAVCANAAGDAFGIVGDRTFTTTTKLNAYKLDVRKCPEDGKPPVWLRYYDGPNMFAKANFEEISFTMPVARSGLPAIVTTQSLWDQMSILQPMPVFDDVAPTYCGFGGSKTLWANGGFNFELTAGNTGFDVGDARPVTPWNSPWEAGFNDAPYDGWTAYPLMALGNGAGGLPAGYAVRTPGGDGASQATADSSVGAKYTLLDDKQTVVLELSYQGATSTYSVPQQLFKDKFLPQAIADGDLAPDDKQVGQVNDFMWRWMLFTNTLTIQKPVSPDNKAITLGELKQYFPMTSSYRDIRTKVRGYPGYNNPDAYDNTLVCGKGLELYGTLWDERLFTDLDSYSTWVQDTADKADPRYVLWRCVQAIARSRQQGCLNSGSEKSTAGAAWNVEIGYADGVYPRQCDAGDPETSAIIAGQRPS